MAHNVCIPHRKAKFTVRPNKRVQPTGWIGAILAPGRGKKAFPIYEGGSFRPAADAQAVRAHIQRSILTNTVV